ncbi:MAG: SDR family NAD(P)-dependent oxidoreductase [Proteobacteria bacterium]|nr:SDR family NAD(P)-dependent oxidoreductase [Pseudomonadota bacterium]
MPASMTARLPAGWRVPSDYLRDHVVLIAGAAGGLGRASALACARAGASVVLLGRRIARLEKVYDEILALNVSNPAIYPLDLAGATPRDYAELAATIEREFSRLDGIVHAAAHFEDLRPAADIEADDWLRAIHVNVSAPFLLTQACLPLLRQSTQASVVFVLDDPQRMAKAYWGGYGVSKHALAGLASILRDEWESTRVRAHAVLPAPMRTKLRHAAYYGEDANTVPTPDATADAVVYLLGAEAAGVAAPLDLR